MMIYKEEARVRKYKIVVKEPHQEAKVVTLEKIGFKTLQNVIDGDIQSLPLDASLDILVDEEGKLKNKEPNIIHNNIMLLVGTIAIIGVEAYDWRGLTANEIKRATKYLNEHSI